MNPGGTAGYGAVVFDREASVGELHPVHGRWAWNHSGMIPAARTTSNNVAEYLGVSAIFDWLIAEGAMHESVHIFGDSRLVISQLWGHQGAPKWKIRGIDTPDGPPGYYAPFAVEARTKLKAFSRCAGFWIPRAENSIADVLSKAELKRIGVQFRIQPESSP